MLHHKLICEMQIKIIMTYYCTAIRLANVKKKMKILNPKKDEENLDHLYITSHKCLYVNIYSNFILNNLKLEWTQMSFNGWIIKQYVHTTTEYSEIKRNRILIHTATQIILQGIILKKTKANLKMLYTVRFHLHHILE